MASAPAHAGALLVQAMASEDRRFNEGRSLCWEMRVQPARREGENLFLRAIRLMVDEVVQPGPQLERYITRYSCRKTLRPFGQRNDIILPVHHQQRDLDLPGAGKCFRVSFPDDCR